MADVGLVNSDTNPASADLTLKDCVWVASGNLTIRHLGIPIVTTSMGMMVDINMPVVLTFAGWVYSDNALLELAAAFEKPSHDHQKPEGTSCD